MLDSKTVAEIIYQVEVGKSRSGEKCVATLLLDHVGSAGDLLLSPNYSHSTRYFKFNRIGTLQDPVKRWEVKHRLCFTYKPS